MPLPETVFSRCTGFAGLAALIGTRCYDRLPEKPVYPCLTYLIVSHDDTDYRTHEAGAVERAASRVQFNAYAATMDAAYALRTQVLLAWSGYKDDCDVGYAFIASVLAGGWNDNLKNYRYIVDVMVEHPTAT